MVNANDIYARLMNGEDQELVAKDLENAMNLGLQMYKDEQARIQKEKEEAEKKAAAEAMKKNMTLARQDDLAEIVSTIGDFLYNWYPDYYNDDDWTKVDIEELDESLANVLGMISTLGALTFKVPLTPTAPVDKKNIDHYKDKCSDTCSTDKVDPVKKAFDDFFKKYSL